jgi:1-deoxy-D-xylulose-5-phosphate reductoisomerase
MNASSSQLSGPPKRVSVLGATGSIGQSTLDLIGRNRDRFDVVALTAQTNVDMLADLAILHKAKIAAIGDLAKLDALRKRLWGTGIRPVGGPDGLVEAASEPADCIVAAIVGAAGLRPTFAAARQGTRVALANKECLVSAGDVFLAEVTKAKAELLPVDSEHSAAFQALQGADPASIDRITLTASGGPFRTWDKARLQNATPEEALRHPNWSMGAKITIDSASLMNKGLELIEAFHLFPVGKNQLDTVVHPQSLVHCLVSYVDGSVLAQLGPPDMRTPISLALAWPARMETPVGRLDLVKAGALTFEAPDEDRFPALRVARSALERGDTAPAILNAANEIAVAAFLNRQIGFMDIAATVEAVLDAADQRGFIAPATTLDEILEVDNEARELAVSVLT